MYCLFHTRITPWLLGYICVRMSSSSTIIMIATSAPHSLINFFMFFYPFCFYSLIDNRLTTRLNILQANIYSSLLARHLVRPPVIYQLSIHRLPVTNWRLL